MSVLKAFALWLETLDEAGVETARFNRDEIEEIGRLHLRSKFGKKTVTIVLRSLFGLEKQTVFNVRELLDTVRKAV